MTNQYLNDLTHVERNVRLRAALALATMQDQAVTDALVSRLGEEKDGFVLEDITWALTQHGDRAVPGVLALLDSSDPVARRQAAHVLSKIARPDFAPHLHGVIADEEPDVAIKAYRAAANTGSPDVVPSLAARLADGDQLQQDQLSVAFAELGTLGVPALVEALGSDDVAVGVHAADALAQIGGPDADPAADALSQAAAATDEDLRLSAVMALTTLSPEEASPRLAQLRGSDDARVAAVAAGYAAA